MKDHDVEGYVHKTHFASACVISVRLQGRIIMSFKHEHYSLDLPALSIGFFIELNRHQRAPALGR